MLSAGELVNIMEDKNRPILSYRRTHPNSRSPSVSRPLSSYVVAKEGGQRVSAVSGKCVCECVCDTLVFSAA